jgi:multiple sugar transport system permease protein
MLWRLMLRPRIGSVSYLLSLFGISYVPWFDSGGMALLALLMTDIWEWTPFITLILLAGLQSIPSDIYEAADLELATPWRKLWDITLPLLRPIIGLAIVLRAVDAFKIFDLIHVMTGGGPGGSTESIAYYTYIQGFTYFDMGLTAAMSLAQLIIVMYMARFLLERAIGKKAKQLGRDNL